MNDNRKVPSLVFKSKTTNPTLSTMTDDSCIVFTLIFFQAYILHKSYIAEKRFVVHFI